MSIASISRALTCPILVTTHHAYDNPTGTMGAVRMLGGFIAGISLARLMKLSPPENLHHGAEITWAALAFLILTFVFPVINPIQSFGFAVLIMGLACQGGFIDRCLRSRLALWLGAISFPFYMIHYTAFKIFQWACGPWMETLRAGECALVLCVLAGVILLLAWALHEWVERPSHRLACTEMDRPPGADLRKD
ncbi:hypothetical protein AOE01nite_05680 [Acetobacter oeni]|uniref:Acyltransferase 3 domain-containing protein n=1 Tax=Acetobacter oeni TaxID=304077 RepID=A0A511XHC5_9PROT|nr:peptidoglycan/LPS O-acetylase OafA/YrhL [Acetobacter oeni]GEN62344.1 hypothetical protein AOE01nite_05680 [Acetobacter oeni]